MPEAVAEYRAAMTQKFSIHPQNPQVRLVRQAAGVLREGGIIAYPTDSCYAFGCAVGDKGSAERIRRIRKLPDRHPFTLVCRDLSELSVYAQVDNAVFRILKAYTPGPYTFVLPGTREVPRRLLDLRRRSLGLRIPNHRVVQALLGEHGAPIMSCTLLLPQREEPPVDAEEVYRLLRGQVDLVIESGLCPGRPTTVVDLTGSDPQVLREGSGVFPQS